MINQPVKIASFLIIGAGVILFALNAFLGGSLNIALPLVFLMLGGFFFMLAFRVRRIGPGHRFCTCPVHCSWFSGSFSC